MFATAVLFPGQGSLTPDAADRARTGAGDLLERATARLGADPLERADESTRFAQPAIFLASIAGWRDCGVEPVALAGHSLGELTALAAAGVLAEEDALDLVLLRGALMDEAAAAAGAGGMLALLGGDAGDEQDLAAAHGLVVANENAPGQVVLSGPADGITAAMATARARGLRALRLDVAAAFHSPAMRPAVQPFAAAVAATERRAPCAPVLSGLTGRPFSDVPRELAEALVAAVRWRAVMHALVALGAERFADVGPGRVLARLASRNVPEVAGAPG